MLHNVIALLAFLTPTIALADFNVEGHLDTYTTETQTNICFPKSNLKKVLVDDFKIEWIVEETPDRFILQAASSQHDAVLVFSLTKDIYCLIASGSVQNAID